MDGTWDRSLHGKHAARIPPGTRPYVRSGTTLRVTKKHRPPPPDRGRAVLGPWYHPCLPPPCGGRPPCTATMVVSPGAWYLPASSRCTGPVTGAMSGESGPRRRLLNRSVVGGAARGAFSLAILIPHHSTRGSLYRSCQVLVPVVAICSSVVLAHRAGTIDDCQAVTFCTSKARSPRNPARRTNVRKTSANEVHTPFPQDRHATHRLPQ